MSKNRWDQIDTLLEEALERPPDERTAFLDAHCDDPALRQEVASLVEAFEEAPSFLDGLADSVVAPALEELQPTQETDPLDLEGTAIGRYAIDEQIGGGGMGVIYRARDTQLDRTVALKFLPPHLITHPEAEERFVREARAAAALDHANIATIHEIGETEDGRRFIAMSYYAGKTLKEKLEAGPVSVDDAVDYAQQIAEGLARAHDAGIVHRDVKPANVMITERRTVKLLDFGVAKAVSQSRLTETGRRLGTAAYMSPEQAEGEAVDARTDLWALGAVLYEMLTGAPPFQGEREMAVLHSILHDELPPVRKHRREAPPALEQIVTRCLQKDPDRRYESAADLLDDLCAVQRGEAPVHADTQSSDADTPDRSIAVLPFETIGTADPTAFTDGIHGDLLTRLSGLSGFQVISRTSVRQYRDTGKSIPQIARELDVRWVLEGEVQEAGHQVRVNTRLVNAPADQQVWARDYRRNLTAENLFDIQGEITEEIARSLQAELSPEEKQQMVRRPTDNLDAYRLYAQGRSSLDQRTEDGIHRALDCFRRAIEQDPDYALAWAGLADALSLFAFYGFPPPDDAPDPMDAARRAVELDPDLGEARASLGIQHAIRHEGPEALRALNRAVELTPSYAEAHIWLGWTRLCLGHPEKGRTAARRAVELNPLAPAFRVYLAEHELANGDLEAALREGKRARKIQPEYGLTHFMEGLVLHHQQRHAAAASSLQQALALVPPRGTPTHDEVRAVLGATHAVSGDATRARELLAQIDAVEAPFSAGLMHAALGDPQAALDAFERVEDWGSFETEHVRYFFPDALGPLRDDPRYDALIQTVDRSWGVTPDGQPRPTAP